MGSTDRVQLKLATYLTLACAVVVGAVYAIVVGIHRLGPPQVP